MRISVSRVQKSLGKLIERLGEEDIIITKNGKEVARLIKYLNEEEKYINSIIREEARKLNYCINGRKVTYEEFLEIDNSDDNRYEYIDGRIYLLASPFYKHQKVSGELFVKLYNWFSDKNCQPLTAPFDITLYKDDTNINIVQPDIVVICDQDSINEKGRYLGTPTLVVEILSNSTVKKDLLRKLNLYMTTGIKEYWIVDPENEIVSIYQFTNKQVKEIKIYEKSDLIRSAVFSDLTIDFSSYI